MKKYRQLFLVLISLSLITCVVGCKSNNNSDLAHEVSLNQRQKDILTEQGLPIEYDELSESQKKAIIAIESMLCYAEEKYNTSFSYAGYSSKTSLEKEHIRAYPTSGDKETDCFTITKTDKGYEDDYINVAANPIFVSYISDGIKALLPDTEIKVYAEITKTSLTEVPTKETKLKGKIEGNLWVFVDGAALNEQDLNDFKTNFSEYLIKNKLYGMAQLILLKDSKISCLTKYNYTDYLSEEYYLVRETLCLNK